MALSGRDHEIGIIYDFLGDSYPTALMSPADLDVEEELRLHTAGLGMAEIHPGDGDPEEETEHVTYVRDPEHIVVKALEAIFTAELEGDVQEGSHAIAIDSIRYGFSYPLLQMLVAGQE